jgi:hypothetical protein
MVILNEGGVATFETKDGRNDRILVRVTHFGDVIVHPLEQGEYRGLLRVNSGDRVNVSWKRQHDYQSAVRVLMMVNREGWPTGRWAIEVPVRVKQTR